MLVLATGYSQSNNVSVFQSESYIINGTPYLDQAIILTISDSDINVKSLGDLKIIKKAVSVRNTSVYHCIYQGNKVEVIIFNSTEKLKVTVRGENLKFVLESDIIDPKQIKDKMDEEVPQTADR